MIKEALQYIVGLGEANLLDVEGCTYSDKPLEKSIIYSISRTN